MQTKKQKEEEESLLFGLRPIMEAIKAGKDIDKLLVQKNLRGDLYSEFMSLLKTKNITCQFVPQETLNRITPKNHQGVIAYTSAITYHQIKDLLPEVFESSTLPLFLILDRITDVRNFGAIARTAECTGVNAIIIPNSGSAQINADALKTSAGALNTMPVCRENNLKDVVTLLKKEGVQIVACTEKTTDNYFEIDFTHPTAIIMGSEQNGIANELIQKSDYKAKLPLKGKISSLNVSVAAGVILYEAVSQRMLL